MNHDRLTRNPARLWALLGALAAVQVAHAQTPNLPAQSAPYTAFEWMQRQTAGNATRLGMEIGGVRGPADRINLSGWAPAGNYGVNPSATGVTVGASTRLNMGGQKFDAEWRGAISKASMGSGMAILLRNGAKLLGPLGTVAMIADMAVNWDQAKIRPNPDPATNVDKPFWIKSKLTVNSCQQIDTGGWQAWASAQNESYGDGTSRVAVAAIEPRQIFGSVWCDFGARVTSTGQPTFWLSYVTVSSKPGADMEWAPANWSEARPTYEAMSPMPAEVLQKQIDWARKQDGQNGIEPYRIDVQPLGVTGPSTLPPTVSEKRETFQRPGPKGTETVERTTRTTTETSVQYEGDKLKIVPKETTKTSDKVTDKDGVVTETENTETTETTESDKPKEDTPDLCEKNPEIIACQKMGTPPEPEPLPKAEKTIDFAPVPFTSSAACPPPVVIEWALFGNSQSISLSVEPICNVVTSYFRPFILLAAAVLSCSIFVGGIRT